MPLGVRNQALLCKWSWRFSREREALWRKVLVARYQLKDACGWWLRITLKRKGPRWSKHGEG